MRWMFVLLFAMSSTVTLFASDPNQPADPCNIAVMAHVRHVDDNCTLFCDIKGFPPIIGENMPVKLKDLKPAASPEANQNIKAFLNTLLVNRSDSENEIRLANIQRGQAFCFCADIRHNGKDISELLIEMGLAYRVIEVKTSEPVIMPTEMPKSNPTAPTKSSPASPPTKSGYVASKNSKVFHRSDCYHVRRMNTDKTVNFKTRDEALKTGRRPCKSCNP